MANENTDIMTLGPWLNGVDYSKPSDELDPRTLWEMQDTRIGNAGQCEKRGGVDEYIDTALNSAATITGTGKHRFSAAASRAFAVAGDTFYEDVSGTWTDRTGGVTITAGDDNTFDTADMAGVMSLTNGTDAMLKWSAAAGNLTLHDVDSRFTTAKWVEWWENRPWWGNVSSGVDRTYYGSNTDIETVGANDWFQIGEDVQGLKKFSNSMIIHGLSTIHVILPTGNATTPFRRLPIELGDNGIGGTVSGRSLVNIPGTPGDPGGKQLFVRRDGVYALTSSHQIYKISSQLEGSRYWGDAVSTDRIQRDRLSQCFAIHYPIRNEVWFWWAHGTGKTKPNHVMIYNYRLLSSNYPHGIWYGPYTGLERNCAGLIDDQVNFGAYDGYVYTHDSGTNDDGAAIAAYGITATPPAINSFNDVRWRTLRSFYEVKGTHVLEVTQRSPGIPSRSKTVEMGGSYDAIGTTFAIGLSAISGDGIVEFYDTELQGHDPHSGVKFENENADEAFDIRKFMLSYTFEGPTRKAQPGVN